MPSKVLSGLDAAEAAEWYARVYEQGRHQETPPEWKNIARSFAARDRRWVVASIPLDALDYQRAEDSSDTRIALARRYARRKGEFPPGVGSYGPLSQKRRTGRVYVQDGNHRALAAQMRGDRDIRMLMPSTEYRAFMRNHRRERKTSASLSPASRASPRTRGRSLLVRDASRQRKEV